MYLVFSGNIVDGVSFYGPFPDIETATIWAEENCEEWSIATLVKP
jgi:hypothetical protein